MLINEYIRTIEVKKPKGRQSHSTSPSIADVKINSDYHQTSIKQGRGGGGEGSAGIKNKVRLGSCGA